jgi:exopolysaccharide biosynthesis polyprenyl glycosylphosphotransferase
MIVPNRFEKWLLFTGDVLAFFAALWLMLLVRYGKFPDSELFALHLSPFSLLFVVWLLVFFIAGLYQKHTVILKSRLPSLLLNTLIVNTILAVAFFYFIPYFVITPKTNLFIYLILSFFLILGWRIYGFPLLGSRRKQNALLIGSGSEMRELRNEVNQNSRYSIRFVSSVDLDRIDTLDFQEEVLKTVYAEGIQIVAIDLHSEKVLPVLPHLYNLIFSKIRFIDMYKVYEDIFDRVPLSLLQYNWFLENISLAPKFTYDFLKRLMDMVLSLVLLVLSLPFYPVVWFALLFDEGRGWFSVQERLGKSNRPVKLYKFRTMTIANDEGKWGQQENKVTRVGGFLRRTRIDELPQLWNVLRGDISLIGPRPEFAEAVKQYEQAIPYYNVRRLIKPGLSGWAQIHHELHPHHGVDVQETKTKLSYDLYYIKNRSFLIDVQIALHTIRELVSRKGA